MNTKNKILSSNNNEIPLDLSTKNLVSELMNLIDSAKSQVASYSNSALVILYWKIGQRINQDILKKERAWYGEKIIQQLSQQLTFHYGNGFNPRALFKMVKFARIYSNEQIE